MLLSIFHGMRIRTAFGIAVAALALFQVSEAMAVYAEADESTSRVEVRRPVRFGTAPRIDPASARGPEILAVGATGEVEIHLPESARRSVAVATERDALISEASQMSTPAVEMSFLAYDSDDNEELLGVRWRPPDTNGDAGIDYYVQWANKGFKVFHKSDGSLAAGPLAGNSIWTGFGGLCETANGGDPIVLYDHLAHRWLFSQFTAAAVADGYQCIAITQGSDPLGPYFLYEYRFPAQLNDYPKFGLWADAPTRAGDPWGGQSGYFLTVNKYDRTLGVHSYANASIVAFDRDAMLAGSPTAVAIDFGDLPCDQECFFSLLPAHLEGPDLPPAGTCNLLVQAFDDEVWGTGSGQDGYQFWEACVDWQAPTSSALITGPRVPTAEFDAELCASDPCVPQPSTGVRLATLSHFTMNRFVVRFLEGTPLPTGLRGVLSHTVDLGGDRAGIRWVRFDLPELGSISIADTATLGPTDDRHRWMPAIGLDRIGNIGVVYSRSGPNSFPSVYFASQRIGDPAAMMRQESSCIDGTGVQTTLDGRWGDYASISIDPVDQCTFWMTNEYVETTGEADWDTRVCTFRFADCVGYLFGDFLETGDLSAWAEIRQ